MLTNDYKQIVRCKYCGENEYWGNMVWLDSRELCRSCYSKALGKYPHRYSKEELIELCR